MKKFLFVFIVAVFALNACSTPATPEIIQTNTPIVLRTETPIPTETSTPTPIPTPTSFGGGSGRLVFAYYRDGFYKLFPELAGNLNIFISNADGTNLTPITNGLNGYNTIQSISPNKDKILITSFKNDPATQTARVNRTWDLFLCSLTDPNLEPIKLASGSSWSFENQAEWIDNEKIVYIGQGANGFGIYTINSDGSGKKIILNSTQDKIPTKIFLGGKYIYWGSQQTQNLKLAYWKLSIDGSDQEPLMSSGEQIQSFQLMISPDKSKVVWIDQSNTLKVAELNALDQAKTVTSLGFSYDTYITWYPDSSKFLLIEIRPYKLTMFSGNGDAKHSIEMPLLPSFSVLYKQPEVSRKKTYSFSPDGKQLLISKPTGTITERVTLILDMEKMSFSEQFTVAINQSSNIDEPTYGTIYWLP